MKIWTVSINGEPEFASDKYFEAASRYNFLVNAGYSGVELKEQKKTENRKEIFVGLGDTTPPADGFGEWEHERVYVVPLIEGISDNLWKRIYNETNDYRPMYGKDGSAVYLDDENWQIVRKINGKEIKIADVVAYC